jgi:hypothetical protein
MPLAGFKCLIDITHSHRGPPDWTVELRPKVNAHNRGGAQAQAQAKAFAQFIVNFFLFQKRKAKAYRLTGFSLRLRLNTPRSGQIFIFRYQLDPILFILNEL